MTAVSILSDEFAQAAALAGLHARQKALASGYPVIFVDSVGRYVSEMPDGRLLEIRFQPEMPRESHIQVLGELREKTI